MTTTQTKPAAEAEQVFGVRFAASVDRTTHVDVCRSEAYAHQFCDALHFCGNSDAQVVRRDPTSDSWVPVTEVAQ